MDQAVQRLLQTHPLHARQTVTRMSPNCGKVHTGLSTYAVLPMSYAKTIAGREALRQRNPLLSPTDRQLLIVCNGRRDAAQLGTLMCAPMDDAIERLIALGYLARVDSLVNVQFSAALKPSSKLPPNAPANCTAATAPSSDLHL